MVSLLTPAVRSEAAIPFAVAKGDAALRLARTGAAAEIAALRKTQCHRVALLQGEERLGHPHAAPRSPPRDVFPVSYFFTAYNDVFFKLIFHLVVLAAATPDCIGSLNLH